LCRGISGLRKILVERLESREDLGKRTSTGDGLDDQTVVFLVQNDLVPWELQLPWNPQRLIAAVSKQPGAARALRLSGRFAAWHMPSIYQWATPWRPELPFIEGGTPRNADVTKPEPGVKVV